MKKKTILILSLIIIIAIFILSSKSLKFFDVVSVSSGDSYYNEQCIDVSQYLSQGYSIEKNDSHGCQIVSKTISYSDVPTGYCIFNSQWVTYPQGVLTQCSNIAGSSATHYYSSGKGDCWYCRINILDEKGGFERVLNTCSYDSGDILVAESFAGPQTLTKSSLRYPIKSFCRAHPTIVTSGLTSYTSTNIPQDLINGKSVTINSGDTITIFYAINNVYNLPNRCSSSSNQALSLVDNYSCSSTLGFTYLCTDGIWDAVTGSCTVMRTAECGVNERLVVNTDGSKNCIYNPPLQVVCPSGYTFDLNLSSCYKVPESINVCNAPYVLYQPTQSDCKGTWELCPQCPTNKICDQSICKAQCSIGIECRYIPNIVCNDSILNGKCTVNGIIVSVCPSDSTWSNTAKACIVDPSIIYQCTNGTMINGVCFNIPSGYVKCPETQVLNNGSCINMSDISNVKNVNSFYVWIIAGIIVILLLIYLIFKKK